MKTIKLVFAISIIALVTYSCAKMETEVEVEKQNNLTTPSAETKQPHLVPLSLKAGVLDSKTTLLGTTISFTAGDKINVFDDSEFVSIYDAFETESGGTPASFDGLVDESGTDFYALYPYNASAQASWNYTTKTVTTVLPKEQTSVFGASNINAGKVNGSGLTFYNVCSILKITIPAELDKQIGSIQITFTGNRIAGNVEVDYSGEKPVLSVIDDASASSSITLDDESGSLPAGTYYLNVAPVTGTNNPVKVYAIDKNAENEFTLDSFISKPLSAGTIKNLGTLPSDMFVTVPAVKNYTLTVGTSAAKWSSSSNSPSGENVEWNDVTWNLKQNASYCQIDEGVMHMGSKSSSCTSATLSTSGIPGTIKRITINNSRAYSSASVSVTVGTTSFLCSGATSESITSDVKNITFTGEASGTITINWTNTSRAIYFGNIDVVYENGTISPVNVTYFIGSSRYNTRVAPGTLLSTILPVNPDCGLSGYEFRGWSESPISETDIEPSYSDKTSVPVGGLTLYGVYALKNVTPGDPIIATLSTSYTDPDDTWTVSDSDGTKYWKIFSDDYINSPSFDLSTITKVTVQMGTFGTGSFSLNISSNGGTTWKNTSPSSNDENASYEITSDISLSGEGYLVFTCNKSTASAGLRVKSITINYTSPSYDITYTGYTTSPTI